MAKPVARVTGVLIGKVQAIVLLVLLEQAEMILRSSEESIPEPGDRADVRGRYDAVLAAASGLVPRAVAEWSP